MVDSGTRDVYPSEITLSAEVVKPLPAFRL